MGATKRCRMCRQGPGFRLDLEPEKGRKNRFRCPVCRARWKLVTTFFRSRHEPVA